MCKNTFLLTLCLCALIIPAASAQTQLKHQVNFDSDRAVLFASSEIQLEQFIKELSVYNEYNLQIIGHTDQDGSPEYNTKLSERRAKSVSQHFIQNGLSAKNISIEYKGESRLLLNSNDEESKSQNRRVEIIAEAYAYDSHLDVIAHLQSDDQESHVINNKKESVINLAKGTQVHIPQDAFCQLNDSPLTKGNVKLTLREAYNYVGMIVQRLFTQTEGQMLETGGMVFIQAEQDGKLLKLNEGKSIDFLLPRQIEKSGMELFIGNNDGNGVIWQETGKAISSVEKDELFVQVDLSDLLNYKFAQREIAPPYMSDMPSYPHPKRKANPPARSIYSEKKYQEVYAKYEEVMKLYHEYELLRPQKLKEWNEEYARRKAILIDLHKAFLLDKTDRRLKYYLARIDKQKDSISHHMLLSDLKKAVSKEIGRIPFPEKEYFLAVFGKNYGEVLKNTHFCFPDFEHRLISGLHPDLMGKIGIVDRLIVKEKYEMGYIDNQIFSRYLVSSSELGWINCDRFLRYEEEAITQLEFADCEIDGEYYLIFKDFKSIIRPARKGDKIVFDGIPIGEEVRLISIGFKGKQAQLAYLDLTLGSDKEINLKHSPASLNEIKNVLRSV